MATITLTVNDGTTSAADGFILAVAVNSPPEFLSAPITETTEGIFYVYRIVAADVETNTLTITAPVSPTWLTLHDYHNGRATLVGKPLQEDVGDHEVTLRVEDSAGGSATQSFIITVHDRLHPPHAVDDTVATDEDMPVVVNVLDNDDDLDGDPLTLVAWTQPQYGVVGCDTLLATCTYTPTNRLSDYTVVFTYTISDDTFVDRAAVVVNVAADNDPPGITAIDDQSTDEGVPVGPIPFTVGDPDTPIPALLLDKASSNTALVPIENIALGGEGVLRTVTVTPTVMSGAATITISVSDGTSTAVEAFVLTVGTSPVNRPPVADAGPDQLVAASATVTLDGSASTDPDGDALVYGWQQMGGQPVSLSDTGVISPTFTAPSSAGVLTFTLTITDTGGLVDTDEVVVKVTDYFIFLPLVVRNN